MLKRGVFFAVFLLSICFASADAYYVDNSGSCSDSPASGSESSPWCTITYGVSRISAGDELYVKQGTYHEVFNLDGLQATQSNPTIISAYQNDDVIIYGAGFDSGRVRIRNSDWLVFKGFKITNTNHGIQVFQASSNILIEGVTIYSIGQEGIEVYDNSHDVQLINNTIYDTGHYNPTWGEGIYIGSGSHVNGDYTHDVLARGNIIHHATAESIELKPRTYNCILEDNVVYDSTTGTTQWSGAAIEIGYSCFDSDCAPQEPRHIIKNNIVHDVVGDCMNVDTSASVYNNVVYSCSGNGIIIGDSDNYLRKVYHNTVDMQNNAIIVSGSPDYDLQNNIGAASGNNIQASSSFFAGSGDHHLVAGAAPIDAGADIRTEVPADLDGKARDSAPDLGAYEFLGGALYSSIPSNRLPPEGWHDIIWHDIGSWTTINVTSRGIMPNSGDVTAALKSLIDGLTGPTILFFPAGTYIINDLHLDYHNNNIIFRGEGDNTIFDVTTGLNAIRLYGTPAESDRPILQDVPPGGKTVKVGDASGYHTGDIVGITEDLENYVNWGKRGRGGVFKVADVDYGQNTITLDRPLAIGLDQISAKNAVIAKFLQIENIAIENIKFIMSDDNDGDTILIRWANNIMIKNCTFINSSKNHVEVKQSRNIIVRDSYFYEAQHKEGGHGYAVVAENKCTGVLYTNNIFQDVNVCLGVQIGTSYLVYSYNLCIDRVKELCNSEDAPAECGDRNWITDPAKNGIMEGDFGMGFTFHGHYPHNNLVEGNVMYGSVIDHIWKDNGPHNTFFRNLMKGIPPFHSAYWLGGAAIHIDGPSDSQNIIGNVFMNNAFIEIGTWSYDPPRAALDTFIGANVNADIRSFANVGGAFVRKDIADWDNMTSDAYLPDSLYLSDKPDFWPDNLAWPPFGPDVPYSESNKIPAELRYEAMQGCRPLTNSDILAKIRDWFSGKLSLEGLLDSVKLWKDGC